MKINQLIPSNLIMKMLKVIKKMKPIMLHLITSQNKSKIIQKAIQTKNIKKESDINQILFQ